MKTIHLLEQRVSAINKNGRSINHPQRIPSTKTKKTQPDGP